MSENIKQPYFWSAILFLAIFILWIGYVDFPKPQVLQVHNIRADTATTGVQVGNAVPTMGSIIVDEGSSINLTANATKTISATTTFTDTNGWADLSTVTAIFWNNTTTVACSADPNECYTGADIACDWIYASTANSRDASCSADLWYHAVPSDTGNWSVALGYETTTWEIWMKGIDLADASVTGTGGQDIVTGAGVDVTEVGIEYGVVSTGATSTTGKSINVSTVSNAPINANISGENMASGTDATITVDYQKFGLVDDGYEDLTNIATDTPPALLNLASIRTEASTNVASDTVYWGILIPGGTDAGYYFGTNTVDATEDVTDY